MKSIPNFELPKTMNALVLTEFNGNPQVQEVEVPMPEKGQILVRIDSSPINPSDNSFLKGLYSTKKTLPVIAGFEASGVVVASGNDFMSRRLLGKSVACFAPMDGDGSWAEYMVTGYKTAIPLKKNVDMEQGAMLLVNPLSVIAMVEMAKKGRHKAIANTAAASALGTMLNRMCIDNGIALVNIVRREDQVELLKSQGATYVISSSSKTFKQDLSKIFSELNVHLAFDAIAGQMTFDLLDALCAGGEVKVYGGLSEQAAMANPGRLIFENKKVSGFWLSEWITHQPMLKMLKHFNKIQKYLAETHQTTVHQRVGLKDAVTGLATYMENMTAGKVLVKPGLK
jgi:NADPH:quinone reductase-like Zn-dependent oxidoreductase